MGLKVLEEKIRWHTLCNDKHEEVEILGEVRIGVKCHLERSPDLAELMPLVLANCTGVLSMYSRDWRNRLWCLSEVGNHTLLCPPELHVPMLIYDIDDSLPAANADIEPVDTKLSRCTEPQDDILLRRAIECTPGAMQAPYSHFSSLVDEELTSFATCVLKA